jgi:hypothetical protein
VLTVRQIISLRLHLEQQPVQEQNDSLVLVALALAQVLVLASELALVPQMLAQELLQIGSAQPPCGIHRMINRAALPHRGR